MPMTFAKPRLIRWQNPANSAWTNVTDHNRSELSVSYERIENVQRMANGTMRKYVIADKREFSTSWDMVPGPTIYTVDGLAGVDAMEAFYFAQTGAFNMEMTFSTSPLLTVSVMFNSFSKELQKRGKYDFYSLSVTLVEV